VRHGFVGPVYTSRGTRDLCGILLPDSGHLQEEEARYANASGYSKHKPALPLYTEEDARQSLRQFEPLEFGETRSLAAGEKVELLQAGHILGASIAALRVDGLRLVFSGDLGGLYGAAGSSSFPPSQSAGRRRCCITWLGSRRAERSRTSPCT
jgi:metallo-beta-lactamase family protein